MMLEISMCVQRCLCIGRSHSSLYPRLQFSCDDCVIFCNVKLTEMEAILHGTVDMANK